MATSDEVAAEAWLDLAEYARELTDKVSGIRTKQTMLALAKLCETLAFVILITLPIADPAEATADAEQGGAARGDRGTTDRAAGWGDGGPASSPRRAAGGPCRGRGVPASPQRSGCSATGAAEQSGVAALRMMIGQIHR